jgi:phosphatidate phosphatase APP1
MLLGAGGLSVISDIDDTIKDSHVANRRELLMNTFVREFRSVDGMADLYRDWQAGGAAFHYVSSSPWQLFYSLSAMRSDFGFPEGTMHLRNFRLRDQFLTKLMFRRKGKALEIRKLVKNLPNRKFILIGDSGEKDPEIYQKIGRKYPNQVRGIFIRNLAGRPMDGDRVARLQRSASVTQSAVFAEADELADLASPLVEEFGGSLIAN